jgi:hypothetical protein
MPAHNAILFAALFVEARPIAPYTSNGVVFGCHALFRGRRMAGCVSSLRPDVSSVD